MENHKGWDWGSGRWCLLGTLVVAVLLFGTCGWLEADPALQWCDALYRAIQLFVLDMSEQNPPPALNVARWVALIIAFYAVAEVLLAVFTQQKQLLHARLRRNHIVVIGNGPEAASLAGNDTYHTAGKKVVVIGDLAPSDQAWLTGRGVSVLPDLSDPHLTRVLRGAKDVVIVGGDDNETANLVCRVASTAPTTQPLALFDSPALARQWTRSSSDAARTVCRVTQLALETLRLCPPFPSDAAVPDPVVVGDGPLAAELTRRIILGWQHDGWRPRILCLSERTGWAGDLVQKFGGAMQVEQMTPLPACVEARVNEFRDTWVPPEKGRGTVGGIRVYLALTESSKAVTIARELLEDPTTHIGLVVDQNTHWKDLFGDVTDRVQLISRDALLADPKVLERNEADLLRAELRRDAESWPPDSPSLFSTDIVRDENSGEIVDVTPDTLRLDLGVHLLTRDNAKAAREVLEAGGMKAETGIPLEPAPLAGPSQLHSMQLTLLDLLTKELFSDTDSHDRQQWALELTSRLPEMMQRSGWTVTSDTPPLLDSESIERLAERVHESYQQQALAEGNPTGSQLVETPWEKLSEFNKSSNRAVVLDYPVKLASVGLDWRRSTTPAPAPALTDEQILTLSVAEHRRWSHFQRRNGREGHYFNTPWDKLTPEQKSLDENIINTMGSLLASEGIEIIQEVAD
ncbi:hypothetical protein FBF34_15085 [Arachnia propionica]|uniref:RCK N-terminal domain-containing protein n=1 Tax=Arachnia propionica TaxID=1750 RepID=A0AB37HYS5_9ACTN|nr:hypothetical protein [Arachnia propionica]QCT39162.1 hypothetical protein FBF34_15085 [Arachnia propionica]QUC11206.1 hypothetical protein J5A53_00405 [Arachnia propionica]RPA18060.1 hypothetical protein EGT56_08875 [Arachnia propionica]